MYGWIWRKLPFGLPGKIGGMLILIGGVGALLWFFAFPRLEPLLPFDDSQIEEAPSQEEIDPDNQIPDEEPSDPPPPADDEQDQNNGDGGGSSDDELLPGG